MIDDRDPVAELVGLVQVVRGEKDGGPAVPQQPELFPQVRPVLRVEAGPSGYGTIRLMATDATRAMAAVFGALASRGVPTRAASVARPTLDDVFLRETGRSLRDAGSSPAGAEAAAGAVEEVAA